MPAAKSTSPHRRFRDLSLIGGHPALDLVNTVKYRGAEDPQDRLGSYADLLEWAVVAGLLTGAEAGRLRAPAQGAALLEEAVALRENLWCLFNRDQVAQPTYLAALTALEQAIAALRPVVSIDPQSRTLRRRVEVTRPRDLIARIVEAAADLLAQRAALRIRTCDGCDCDWLFIDRTKAGRRRWCDSRTCGNQARVRAFRDKHQGAG